MLHIAIPSAFTHYRLLGGIPLAAALIVGAFPITLFCLIWFFCGTMSFFYSLVSVPFIIVLWLFAAHQTQKDLAWFLLWVYHLQLKGYYAAS